MALKKDLLNNVLDNFPCYDINRTTPMVCQNGCWIFHRKFAIKNNSSNHLSNKRLLPAAELLLLLNNITSDGCTAGVLWRLPFKVHTVHVPVIDNWYRWFTRSIWRNA